MISSVHIHHAHTSSLEEGGEDVTTIPQLPPLRIQTWTAREEKGQRLLQGLSMEKPPQELIQAETILSKISIIIVLYAVLVSLSPSLSICTL